MRISTEKSDFGYITPEKQRQFRVLRDGVEVQRCITADDDLGIAVVVKVDLAGNIVVNREHDEIEHETLRGTVVIEKIRE